VCYCRCSVREKCQSYEAKLMRSQQMMYDAKSAARVATRKVDSLQAELSTVKEVRDKLDDDLRQAHHLLRERTESLMHNFDQSVAVQVRISMIVSFCLFILAYIHISYNIVCTD